MTRHAHWWEDQGARLVCAQGSTGIPLIEFNDIPPSAPPGIMPTTQSLRVLAEIVALWAEKWQVLRSPLILSRRATGAREGNNAGCHVSRRQEAREVARRAEKSGVQGDCLSMTVPPG